MFMIAVEKEWWMNPRVAAPSFRMPAQAYEKFRGMWIALTKAGNICAIAKSIDDLEHELAAAGIDPQQVAFDFVEDDDICLGGAELH
jgi:hypothetical protein